MNRDRFPVSESEAPIEGRTRSSLQRESCLGVSGCRGGKRSLWERATNLPSAMITHNSKTIGFCPSAPIFDRRLFIAFISPGISYAPGSRRTREQPQQQMNYLTALFARQRSAFRVSPMPAAEQRIQWLRAPRDLLFNEQVSLIRAISEDFSNRSADETLLGEIMPSLHGINHAIKRVTKWMKPSRRAAGMTFQPAVARVVYQPLGVVVVIAPWNCPLYLSIGPLDGPLAVVNRVMIKRSEYTPATAQLVKTLLARIFPEDLLAVVLRG